MRYQDAMIVTDERKTQPKAHGAKYFSKEQDSWIVWALFPASMTDEEILNALDNPCAHYSGPGQLFADAPYIYRVGKRALLTQRGGYDV